MPFQERKYKADQTILKILGTDDCKKIKVIHMNVLRTAGLEDENDKGRKGSAGNDEKLEQSISRAKSKIFELAFCNPWEWFWTATLDPKKYNRTDLEKFHRDLTQWIRNYNRLHGTSIKFLLIPEQHHDGVSWHIHGLLHGLPVEHLAQFKLGDKMSAKLAEKVANGEVLYNWIPYLEKFGFTDLEPIKSPERVSKYITKYISKSLEHSVRELNAHLYYHSRGLKMAEVIKKGTMSANIVPDWENEYCSITTLDYSEELLQTLKDSFI